MKAMNTTLISEKELIIRLIKDDLRNTRLVLGLNNLGLIATEYHLHLSDTIFKLMGIKDEEEELFEEYLELCEQVTQLEIFQYPELLNSLALCIYTKLMNDFQKRI